MSGVVGRAAPRFDAADRVTGRARFADDYVLQGMLRGKIIRSPHANARIVRIDASRALALPGVHAVITGRDLPAPYGIIPWTQDETALAVDRALYVGDGVAAVAAIDEATAVRAAALVDIEYEPLPHVVDPERALEAGAPKVNDFAREGNITKHVALASSLDRRTPPSSRTARSVSGSLPACSP